MCATTELALGLLSFASTSVQAGDDDSITRLHWTVRRIADDDLAAGAICRGGVFGAIGPTPHALLEQREFDDR
jgi:hypothetical protein